MVDHSLFVSLDKQEPKKTWLGRLFDWVFPPSQITFHQAVIQEIQKERGKNV